MKLSLDFMKNFVFSFLKGRLGTHGRRKSHDSARTFSFLKGRLGTESLFFAKLFTRRFSFLKGRLGTIFDATEGAVEAPCFHSLKVG